MTVLKMALPMLILFFFAACEKNNTEINEGNDPNFKIVANDDGILKCYTRKVAVFGIKIDIISTFFTRELNSGSVVGLYSSLASS